MSVHVQDPVAVAMVKSYAEEQRVGFDEAIKLAVSRARGADDQKLKMERLARSRAILAQLDAMPRTGEVADKAFFDELSGD